MLTYNIDILILASLAGVATLIGVYLGSLLKRTRSNIIFGASFAASLMILISAFELIPNAFKSLNTVNLFFWVLVGILMIWLFNKFIPHLHSVKEIKCGKRKSSLQMSYLIAVGLILHDFPEGFAITSSFGVSNSLGFLVLATTFIHNIPEGYILTLSRAKNDSHSFCYRTGLLSLLATFLGAVLGINLLAHFSKLNPIFLSLAAGAMLFIAIHELLPESFKYKDIKMSLFGIGMAGGVYALMGLIL